MEEIGSCCVIVIYSREDEDAQSLQNGCLDLNCMRTHIEGALDSITITRLGNLVALSSFLLSDIRLESL